MPNASMAKQFAQDSSVLQLLTNGRDNRIKTPCIDNRLTCAKIDAASPTFDAFFTQSSTGKRQSLLEDICSSSTSCTCQAAKKPSPPCQMYARTASPNPSRQVAKKLSSQLCSKCFFVAWRTGFHLQITPQSFNQHAWYGHIYHSNFTFQAAKLGWLALA